MQLGAADSTSLATLLGMVRFRTNTLDNTSAFPDDDIKALINQEQKVFQAELLAALNYSWRENTIDGTGDGLINLTQNDPSYPWPTDMIQLERMEINYSGVQNGYRTARVIHIQTIRNGIANTENYAAITGSESHPVVYVRNRSFIIDPIPRLTVSGGIKVWGTKLLTDLSGETDEPVFAEAYHPLITFNPAKSWCATKEMFSKADRLAVERQAELESAIRHYATLDVTEQKQLKPLRHSFR